jgi:hypothetical protein
MRPDDLYNDKHFGINHDEGYPVVGPTELPGADSPIVNRPNPGMDFVDTPWNRPHEGMDYVDPYTPVGQDDLLNNLPDTVYDDTPGAVVQVNPSNSGPDLTTFGGGVRRDNNINGFGGLFNLGSNLAYNTYGQNFAAFPTTQQTQTTRPSVAGFDINYSGNQNVHYPGTEGTSIGASNPEAEALGARETAAARAAGELPPSDDPEADVRSASAVSPEVRAAQSATASTRAGEILLGQGPNGQPMWWTPTTGWQGIGSAPQDLRFAKDSGTGNWQADQFTNAYQLSGGDPGSPNRPPASDRGNDMFFGGGAVRGQLDEDGNVVQVANPAFGQPGRKWVTPSQAESARLGLSFDAQKYNAWIMAHNPSLTGTG